MGNHFKVKYFGYVDVLGGCLQHVTPRFIQITLSMENLIGGIKISFCKQDIQNLGQKTDT